MKLEEAINKYFSRDSIIDSMCKYQLYYQIGLGNVVFLSTQDLEETQKKLEELNLQINSQKVFESMQEIVLHLSHNDDFEEKFESHLRLTALAQMLNDFIEADKGLIDSKPFADMIYEQIKDDKFFNDVMKEQFDNDYDFILATWEATITDEIASDIKDVVVEIFYKDIE
ncbi:MAG: hypothetical protein KAQ94_03910 [Arcobacteraceae bacterium]|nr:hypothetical protein [Arcobacteraceae bacterium]